MKRFGDVETYRGGIEVHGAVALGDLFFAEFEKEVAHGEGDQVCEERYRHHVHHLGCEVWGVRRGVWGVGCEAWGVGCGVWGVGCGVWDVGCGMLGAGFGVWGLGCGVCCLECGFYAFNSIDQESLVPPDSGRSVVHRVVTHSCICVFAHAKKSS